MRKKILSKIFISIISLTLISTAIVSSVFAKYTVGPVQRGVSTRPAIFEVVFDNDHSTIVEANFSRDGEPGNPIGYSEYDKNYSFSVINKYSEVKMQYKLTITFAAEVANFIRQARANRYADGLCCDYKVYVYNGTGYDSISGDETVDTTGAITWSYVNNKVALSPNDSVETKYQLRFTFYNSTDMPSSGNGDEYFYSSDSVTINVEALQID